jgi:hypothetical protein
MVPERARGMIMHSLTKIPYDPESFSPVTLAAAEQAG